MSKRKRKSKDKPKKQHQSKPTRQKRQTDLGLVSWQKDLLLVGAISVIVLIFFAPLALQQQIYPENDNIHFPVVNNLTYDYQARTGEIAYWNPNPWGGIPNVFKIPRSKWSPDYYLTQLSELLSLPFIFFLWGAIGMYLLSKHLGFGRILSAFGALLFVLAPYCKALVIVGHVDKIQALGHLPWVLLSLLLLLRKPKPWHLIFFALAFALELRSNHYQVVFYGAVVMAFITIGHLWPMLQKGAWSSAARSLILPVVGGLLALLIAAEPFVIAYKNSGRSVRSQQVIRLSDQTSERKDGVSKRLVQNWSFAPSELLTLIIPRAKGGLSDDVYPQAHYLGFQDGEVSSYWGPSPFNATYYYIGAVLFLLLGFTFFAKTRGPTFWALLLVSGLMIIWALGTRLGFFYDFCYHTIPFFKNFRTPSTSLSMLSITIPLLSLYGLQSIRDLSFVKKSKQIWMLVAAFAAIGVLLLVYAGAASFVKPDEDSTAKMVMALQGIRKEMFLMDIYRYLAILLIGVALILAYLKRKMTFPIFSILILIAAVTDLFLIQQRYPFKTVSQREFDQRYLAPTSTVKLLQGDPESFRVLPFATSNFGLPAHVQTFGGGNDLQMSINAFEVTVNCLHHKLDGRVQLNWNVLDMMNIKYIVSQRELQHDFLALEYTDEAEGLYTYRYKFNRPRGYFVDRFEVITEARSRLERLNQKQFDSRSTAILERHPGQALQPASRSITEVIHFSPNKVTYNVNTPVQGLFVMSDIYAPEAQEVYLDGDLVTEVYSTNHLIQSIIVPPGFHTVELRYKDDIYRLSFWLTRFGLILSYLILVIVLYYEIRKRPMKFTTK